VVLSDECFFAPQIEAGLRAKGIPVEVVPEAVADVAFPNGTGMLVTGLNDIAEFGPDDVAALKAGFREASVLAIDLDGSLDREPFPSEAIGSRIGVPVVPLRSAGACVRMLAEKWARVV
jgi:hypothetical protein